jgi:hypothetical protein
MELVELASTRGSDSDLKPISEPELFYDGDLLHICLSWRQAAWGLRSQFFLQPNSHVITFIQHSV